MFKHFFLFSFQCPSSYSTIRLHALQYVLDRFSNDAYEKVPLFIFGDFNFRLDTKAAIQVNLFSPLYVCYLFYFLVELVILQEFQVFKLCSCLNCVFLFLFLLLSFLQRITQNFAEVQMRNENSGAIENILYNDPYSDVKTVLTLEK